jgi:amino acid transporter
MVPSTVTDQIRLKRNLSLPLLVLYGLGTTIGAGIYALIGEVAAVAGYLAPISFLVASFMAGITATAFAELARRLPRAAGEALYVREGLGSVHFSTLIGLCVVFAGLVSSAALVNGFVGYLHEFVAVDRVLTIVLVTVLLGGIAAWGIAESVVVASLVTLVEVGGLALVIAVSHGSFAGLSDRWSEFIPAMDMLSWGPVFAGAVLAFYAYIGFEDMVNVAEEVVDVRRNLPAGIFLTLGISTLAYVLLMTAAVLTMTPAELADSEAPLADLYQYYVGEKAQAISAIGLFAIINGALIQIIMAARVFYGLGSMGQLPAVLSTVHPRTRTPLLATALVTFSVLVFALLGTLASLAKLTSLVMLVIFACVNLSLWMIKLRDPHPEGIRVFPFWVPIAGFLISAAFVIRELIIVFDS